MINISFNGKVLSIKKGHSVSQLIEQFTDLGSSFAVAINKEFVPRSVYAETILSEGDDVELVIPMQGG